MELDVLVVGAGFGGVYGVYRYRQQGLKVKCVEAAPGVGGVWYHNRYPGARCDVRSVDYSYSFSEELQKEWRWKERYSDQKEILAYIEWVVDRLDLARDIELNTRVTKAHWNASTARWEVETDNGKSYSCRFLVLATGALSSPKELDFPGLDRFKGEWYQTSKWPHHDVSFRGKNVGVIGTGSSGIQCIPVIAETAKSLKVFQRTPAFSMPARNVPLSDEELSEVRDRYMEYRHEMRTGPSGQSVPTAGPGKPYAEWDPKELVARQEANWQLGGLALGSAVTDGLVNQEANDATARFIHNKIRGIVKDPETAEALCPTDYPVSTRRPCLDTNYYETYNRDNVTLVNLRKDPMVGLTETGIRTESGDHPLDMVVFATGFDAFTGAIAHIDIRNAQGEHVMDKWKDGPRTYMGMTVSGFPNMFIVTGPGSPSVLANCIMTAEVDIDWIGDCIAWLDSKGYQTIEAEQEAQDKWVAHVSDLASHTLYPKANSWYMGDNIPGKPRVFLPYIGGLGNFVATTRAKAAADYEGFVKA